MNFMKASLVFNALRVFVNARQLVFSLGRSGGGFDETYGRAGRALPTPAAKPVKWS